MKFDSDDIRLLRRYTGDYFTPENGYDFRKPLTRSRQKTVLRYLEKIRVLTGNGYILREPAKGEKRVLFDYTGQKGYNKFKYAIVRTPKSNVKTIIHIDKKAPRDQQVRLDYPHLKQSEIKISREHVLYFIHNDLKEDFIEFVNQVAPDAQLFIINSEGGSLWSRTAGDAESLADIVFDLAERYDTKKYSRSDYSHFDNWIESISALSNYERGTAYINKRYRETREKRQEFFRRTGLESRNMRWSSLHDGYFVTEDGEYVSPYFISNVVKKEVLRLAKKDAKKKGKKGGRYGKKGRR